MQKYFLISGLIVILSPSVTIRGKAAVLLLMVAMMVYASGIITDSMASEFIRYLGG